MSIKSLPIQQRMMTRMLQQVPDSFDRVMRLGGPVTLILMALSIAALTIIIVKSLQMYAERSRNKSAIDEALHLWQQNDRANAIARLAHD